MRTTQGHNTKGAADTPASADTPSRLAPSARRRRIASGTVGLGVAGFLLVATAVPVAALLRTGPTGTVALAPGFAARLATDPAAIAPTAPSPEGTSSVGREHQATRRAHASAQPATLHRASTVRSAHAVVATVTRSTATTSGGTSRPTAPTPTTPTPSAVTRPAPTHAPTPKPAPTPTSTHAAPAPAPGPSAAAQALMAHLNPTLNIAPSPNFLSSGPCTSQNGTTTCANPCLSPSMTWPTTNDTPACNDYVLQAIDSARALEGLGPMTLPSNWYSLSTAEQLFVVVDLERTARGLPAYAGINATLSAEAQRAAGANGDPSLAPGFAVATTTGGAPAWGGAWSGGFSVLAADYIWMYDDGWGGSAATTSNVACTSAGAKGCWGHRDELLGYDPGYNPGVGLDSAGVEVGVGFAVVGHSGSFTVLLERPSGSAPATGFTWAQDVAPYL